MVWYGMVWPGRALGVHHEELRDPGVRVGQLHALWGLGMAPSQMVSDLTTF